MTGCSEFDGTDIKIAAPLHVAEKYVQLARDARTSGDPVAAGITISMPSIIRLIAAARSSSARTSRSRAPR